jgi:protein SHQ1
MDYIDCQKVCKKMITPKFTLEQNNDFLVLKMHCPYIKATDVEIDISGTEFRFYCRPYFLRLHFPCPLIENGNERSIYDIESGEVTLHLPKETPGLFFDDLDLLTKLMDIKPAAEEKNKGPLVQMMESDEIDEGVEEELDWNLVQTLPQEEITNGATYGFNNLYQGYGSNIHELAKEILDISDLDSSTPHSRRQERLLSEEIKFDKDYYMYDFIMNEDISRLLDYTPESWKALTRIQQSKLEQKMLKSDELLPEHISKQNAVVDEFLRFNEREQEQLLQLPNKSYLIDTSMKPKIYLGLVDILFSYCYNVRTTEGEDTVESAWTICKLSGTFASFDLFSSLKETLVCNVRRCLCFPLYRSFELSLKVIQDVVVLLKLGKRAILKAFLQIKSLLQVNETMYLMDRIFITDYCVWLQKASDKQIKSLASELHHFTMLKEFVGWDLEELECNAHKTSQEEKHEMKQ